MPVWLSILASSLLPAVGQIIPTLPHEAAIAVTVVASVAGNLYHLFSPVPGAPK